MISLPCGVLMEFDWYQWQASQFAKYPNKYANPEYPTLGLVGEAGEVANKVKKLQRDGLTLDEIRPALKDELGDVLWYLAALCDEIGVTLEEVASTNLHKLTSRQARGKISGEGDAR